MKGADAPEHKPRAKPKMARIGSIKLSDPCATYMTIISCWQPAAMCSFLLIFHLLLCVCNHAVDDSESARICAAINTTAKAQRPMQIWFSSKPAPIAEWGVSSSFSELFVGRAIEFDCIPNVSNAEAAAVWPTTDFIICLLFRQTFFYTTNTSTRAPTAKQPSCKVYYSIRRKAGKFNCACGRSTSYYASNQSWVILQSPLMALILGTIDDSCINFLLWQSICSALSLNEQWNQSRQSLFPFWPVDLFIVYSIVTRSSLIRLSNSIPRNGAYFPMKSSASADTMYYISVAPRRGTYFVSTCPHVSWAKSIRWAGKRKKYQNVRWNTWLLK